MPCVLGGLRAYGIGTDTKVYGDRLARQAIASPTWNYYMNSIERTEVGFLALNYIIMKTLGHVNWCYFFYQLITISCVYIGAYKHRKTISLPYIMLLWFLNFYSFSYTGMRQGLAAAIIFMNIDQLEKKQYKKFAITIAVACLFHRSAMVLFALFLGMHIFASSEFLARKLWLKSVIFCSVIAFSFFLKSLLLYIVNMNSNLVMIYSGYITSDREEALGRTIALVVLGEILMTFLYRKQGELVLAGKDGCRNNIDFYRYNLIFFLLCYFAIRLMTGRILIYTNFINIILMAAIPRFIKEKHLRFMAVAAILGYNASQWCYNTIYQGSGEVYPYKSILDNMLL